MATLTTEQERVLSRVRDMLTLAENAGATPEEAEAFTAKAAELLAKYNIDAALASARQDTREVPVDRILFFPQPYAKQHTGLFYNILRIFGGEAVVIQRQNNSRSQNKGITVHVYAFEADLTAVDVLYTSLLLQAQSQLQRAKVPYYDNTKSFRVSWWIGFTNEIIGRLQAAYAKAKEETSGPGTDIVLRDRALEVQAKFRADHARTRKVQGSEVTSMSGFRNGEETARRVNIHNRPETGQQRRTALG